jgi:HEAT repeat protein/TolA-binding protein
MKCITLAVTMMVAAATAVAGQDPTPPARPARPATAPTPTPAPRAIRPVHPDVAPMPAMAPMAPMDLMDLYDLDMIRDNAREVARASAEMAREASRVDVEHIREMAREASRIDVDRVREQAREASRLAMEDMHFDIDVREQTRMAMDMAHSVTPLAPMAPLAPISVTVPSPGIGPFGAPRVGGRDFTDRLPPAPWAQGDPADSVYRAARNALTNGEYGRAAKLFADITKNYPKSAYQNDARYYEALARYKVGTTEELKAAARLLEPMTSKGSGGTMQYVDGQRRGANDSEVAALYARVNGALAQRGDREAASKVEKVASETGGAPCDQEDIQVRTEALNVLSQMDPAAANPILRRVLDKKDECSASLRRSAVFMLGRRGDAESAALLMSVAKSDPNASVRSEAIGFLGRLPGDAGLNALEEMLRTEQDERIQRAVVRALMSSDNAKARSSMRALIDRKDAPLSLRVEAINSLNNDRATTDDAAYLRNLYGKADNDRMKEAIISALSRMGGAENDQFILSIARNTNESSQLRGAALSRYFRSSTGSVADIAKLYDSADNYNMRQQIISVLSNRKEPEATDKLVDIIKTSTVPSLRVQAINALQRKNDPRAIQLLTEILDGKKP